MPLRISATAIIGISLLSLSLSACFKPPYNNFNPDHRNLKQASTGAAAGAGVGYIVGVAAGTTGVGAVVGGLVGTAIGLQKTTRAALIQELQKQDIQYVQYGSTITLVVPTDRYFQYNSPRLNDICFPGLNNIVRLIKMSACSRIYVAGFTDDVGSRKHKRKLSQAQAETMLTFLWAYDIPAKLLQAEGYGDKYDIGDNHFIRGSAYNRRIEIQWFEHGSVPIPPMRG